MGSFKKAIGGRGAFSIAWQQQVAAGSLLTTLGLFTNPSGSASARGGEIFEILEVSASWDVVSTSGTIDIRNVPAATAFTGGTSVVQATFNTGATARAVQKALLATAQTTRLLQPGATLSMILGGTLTGLVGCSVTVVLQAFRNIRAR